MDDAIEPSIGRAGPLSGGLIATIAIVAGFLLLFFYAGQSMTGGEIGRDFTPATASVREAGWACATGNSWEGWCTKQKVDARNAAAADAAPRGGYFVRFAYSDAARMNFMAAWPVERTGLTPETAFVGATFPVQYDPKFPGRVVPTEIEQAQSHLLLIAGLVCLGFGGFVSLRTMTRAAVAPPSISVPDPYFDTARPSAGLIPPDRMKTASSIPVFGKRKPDDPPR